MFFFSKLKKGPAAIKIPHFPIFLWAVFASGLLLLFLPHSTAAFNLEDYTIKPALAMMLSFNGILLSASKTLFEWIIVPDNMKSVMDNSAVYTMWRFVRDFFNTILIMILLFSAFATIFQASTSYHYKRILLNLVLMALLVNFSYPISRFIIDLSNILMYGFLNQMEGAGSFWSIIQHSKVNTIIGSRSAETSYLFSAVIFSFMFAITLLTIAILLVIRTIALTLFIIFSPIAFLGTTQPGTDLANVASNWWKDFIKYCFSGPIIAFMLVLANQMMIATTKASSGLASIANGEVDNNAALSSAIGNISFFALPLVILWLGIVKAQSSGIAGANMIVGQGIKAMKWAGNAPHRSAWWVAKKTGIPGGVQQKLTNWKKSGLFGSDRQAEREAIIAGTGPLAVPRVTDQMYLKKLKEASESHDMPNMGVNALRELMQNGNRYERSAAIQELISQGAFDMNNIGDATAYQTMQQEFGTTGQVFNQINNKLKAIDPVSAFAHLTDANERQARITEFINSNKFKAENLGARSLGDANFMETAFREGAITNDDLDKLRKKSPGHERNIISSLRTAANNFGDPGQLQNNIDGLRALPQTDERDAQITLLDNDLRRARSIHTAHIAQIGTFHPSLADDATLSDAERAMRENSRTHIISRLNADNAKRIRIDTGTPEGDELLRTEFAQNFNSNKFKAIMTNMDNDAVVRDILDTARRVGGADGTTGSRNAQKATEDIDLMHM